MVQITSAVLAGMATAEDSPHSVTPGTGHHALRRRTHAEAPGQREAICTRAYRVRAEAGCLDYMYERDQAGSECTEITSAHRLLVRVQEVAAERRNANILRARRKRRLGSRAGLHRWFTRAL